MYEVITVNVSDVFVDAVNLHLMFHFLIIYGWKQETRNAFSRTTWENARGPTHRDDNYM